MVVLGGGAVSYERGTPADFVAVVTEVHALSCPLLRSEHSPNCYNTVRSSLVAALRRPLTLSTVAARRLFHHFSRRFGDRPARQIMTPRAARGCGRYFLVSRRLFASRICRFSQSRAVVTCRSAPEDEHRVPIHHSHLLIERDEIVTPLISYNVSIDWF
jgi:hypothetical protein